MLETAILKTLIYRDLFDYPLTAEEIWRFLVEEKATRAALEKTLAKMVLEGLVGERDGFFFLPGREAVVPLRQEREAISRGKLEKIKRYAGFLRLVPWVRAVFATGAVAVGNAEEEADLDILLITAPNRLWLSRFLVFSILIALGIKRKAKSAIGKDKVCPNMFFDLDHLALPKDEQNLYTAHEAVQARLIWERGPIGRQFLTENRWIKKFLPNAKFPLGPVVPKIGAGLSLFNCFERIVYRLQLKYMARRRTKEVVAPGRILFHSVDLPAIILKNYREHLISFLPRSRKR